MGSTLFGSTIVIAAIECDIGNFVKQEYNFLALGTFSGMIDGFASLGSVISQPLITIVNSHYGWNATFVSLAIIVAIAALPAIQFLFFEISQYKRKKQLQQT